MQERKRWAEAREASWRGEDSSWALMDGWGWPRRGGGALGKGNKVKKRMPAGLSPARSWQGEQEAGPCAGRK